jgi:hypothetical protein
MSKTELQKEAPQDPSSEDDIVKWVNLPGGCAVHGVHLVCEKLAGIVSKIMKRDVYKDNFGVRCIEFKNNGFPAGKAGMAYIDGGAIAINLEEIWSSCLSVLEEGEVKLGMTGVIWDELITTLLHEIHHIDACRDSEYRAIAADDPSGADEDAEAWAKETLTELAKVFDIEPGALSDMSFFKVKLMELMTSDLKDEDWVVRTRVLLEDGIMYHDEDNDITIKTFREYLRGIEDPDEKDDNWEQGISVIDLIFSMDDGSVVKTAEVLPEPEKVVESAVEETVAPEGVETPVAASPAQTLFAPAPMTDVEDETAVAAEDVIDMVALPDHIVAEQEQVAAAAAAVPEVAPQATSYEPNGLSSETIVAFLKDVYMRLYSHMFNKCGRQLDNDQGFTNPGAVLEPVSIADLIQLHQAKGLIMEYDTLDAQSHRQPEQCQGHIRGLVFTKSNVHGIPAYAIYLNLNGQRVKRSLIAQNTAKKNAAGQYSSQALEARMGHAIAWLMSEDENKKFVAKIRDNIYEAL